MVRAVLNSVVSSFVRRCSSSPSRNPAANCSMMAVSVALEPSGRLVCCLMVCGMSASRISSGLVAGMAPCRMSALQPALMGLVILPGTTNTSLPCAKAWAAVLRVPLRAAASTISTASAKPETRRLRSRKLQRAVTYGSGSSVECSDKIAPPC